MAMIVPPRPPYSFPIEEKAIPDVLRDRPGNNLDKIFKIITALTNAPIAYIGVLDGDRLWVKCPSGEIFEMFDVEQTFCRYTFNSLTPLLIKDASLDARFVNNPFVSGEPFIRSYAGFPIKSPDGKILGTVAVADTQPREFTVDQCEYILSLADQIGRVIDLERQNDVLKSQNKIVKGRKESLSKLLQHQEKVMTILGHDTRGPLIFIKDLLLMINENKLSFNEAQELFGLMESQIGTTLSLLDNLTNWGTARICEDKLQTDLYDLAQIVDQSYRPYSLSAAKKNIDFVNGIKSGEFETNHKETMTFIIRNLINNAIKYTEAGSIKVTGEKKEKYYEICIEDTGIGMPKDMIRYLFITKFDSRTGTQGEQGAGLGLMLIFDFVEQLNGYIEAESDEGIGTRFRVGVPLT